jgi:hypothetical protein
MHPMFVKLYLEADSDDLLADEQDKRGRANRARRLQTRTAVRVTARNQDRQPRR